MSSHHESGSAKGQESIAQLDADHPCGLGDPDLASPCLHRGSPCWTDRVALGSHAAGDRPRAGSSCYAIIPAFCTGRTPNLAMSKPNSFCPSRHVGICLFCGIHSVWKPALDV